MKLSYESPEIVDFYLPQNDLQLPEKEIFAEIQPRLKTMKMLDLGVGAGRTTIHFMHEVAEYIGVDYSENFIHACKKKFQVAENSNMFQVGDARNLHQFPDEYFDFVLFSFNGLDTIKKEDRLLALKEIKRVCKTNGLFCFSAHNINSINRLFKLKLSSNIKDVLWQVRNLFRIIAINKNNLWIKNKAYTTIYDGHLNFNMCLYYINPLAQIKQLESLGFQDVRLFSLDKGIEIDKLDQAKKPVKDYWVYYMCTKS